METIYDFFAKPVDPKKYTGLQISLASSEQVKEWSNGEITKPETINYRTFKPEKEGLFCAKTFGPVKDYECNCGKYKRMKHRGVVCEKCNVEVIQSKVRRERMGHIELVAPVAHIWFFKSLPSKIGNAIDVTLKNLESVLYFDSHIVLDPKETGLGKKDILSDDEFDEARDLYGDGNFIAGTGAEAIKVLLDELDVSVLCEEIEAELALTKSISKKQKLSKRLKVLDAFKSSGIDPSCMIMTIIPVLPPDLRPLVPLEGGRFATSDLNDLYRRVINRNNRLKRLVTLNAPDIIVRNEKRMLQEAVDVLFDNGRHGRVVTGTNKRPLKSLSETLKGKQGRFRQNLLGKRVDYSGRTVIVVGPYLKLHQCGLPKKIAIELFKPFIYNKLEKKGLVATVKSAKKMVENAGPEVWDALDEVVHEYPIMLNRAPTLHRLGIQAFEPILIEGKAIQLHPLVCTAFNADFDGDQMAVHIPLSVEAQIEARVLMLSSNNILSPANGQPIIIPTQDIVLGIYYMTMDVPASKGDGSIFSNIDEVIIAYDNKEVRLQTKIKVRINGKKVDTTVGRVILFEEMKVDEKIINFYHFKHQKGKKLKTFLNKLAKTEDLEDFLELENNKAKDKVEITLHTKYRKKDFEAAFDISDEEIKTIYNFQNNESSKIFQITSEVPPVIDEDLDEDISVEAETEENKIVIEGAQAFFVIENQKRVPFDMINTTISKSSLRKIIDYSYRNIGLKGTVIIADRFKDIGYKYSTIGGLSIAIDDMLIPAQKWDIVKKANEEVNNINKQYIEGYITQGEKYNRVVDVWAQATDDIANAMMEDMEKPVKLQKDEAVKMNAVFMMADSGARGSKDQMRQLAGMRGLMAKPSGEIIETPITANFREGLTVLQYFTSTHGARKGLADTALKTANSGYLTRRLADVAQDCMVVEKDCGTIMGLEIEALMEGGEVIQSLGERILGRIALEDILDPFTNKILVKEGEEIDEKKLEVVINAGINKVKIRSVLTCNTDYGVCVKCYGRDLAHGLYVNIGQPVGILAAQSIGEPGTQLTMRTFHIGGTASRTVEVAEIRAGVVGEIKFFEGFKVAKKGKSLIVMNRKGLNITIIDKTGREREVHSVIYGAMINVSNGTKVNKGDILASWDPFSVPIITEVDGVIKFGDLLIGKSLSEKVDSVTGKSSLTVIEAKDTKLRPRLSIKGKDKKTIILSSSEPARYLLPTNAILLVEEKDVVKAGDIIAKLPRATTKTKDITGGLPRIAELFEVRKPKEIAVVSEIDGYVSIAKGLTKGKQKVTVISEVGEKREYLIPKGKHLNVYEGDYLKAGDFLVDGSANPQDILNIKGEVALARYLVDEVQEVYRLQGVHINDKHIEVIVRQMMRQVNIKDGGDTRFVPGDFVNKVLFNQANSAVLKEDKRPAIGEPLILGITKAALNTESFVSAASFQETTKVLTEASIRGKLDILRGLKENIIMGRIVPAGTGARDNRMVKIKTAYKP